MSNARNWLLATFAIAMLGGTQSAFADEHVRILEVAQFRPVIADEKTLLGEAAQFRPARPAPKIVILKVKVVEPDTSLAFRIDETLHTSKLSTGELLRQIFVDMPPPHVPAQASTPRITTDGRGK
jgi:hypothetical protein